MAGSERRGILAPAALGISLALLAGCAASPAILYGADAPRNGADEPVDAATGLPLPGTAQGGGGGSGM